MPNYSYYRSMAEDDEDEDKGYGYSSPAGENPASSWIASVEDPNSVVSQYGTEYGTAENPTAATARGTVPQRPLPNVDQWGNELPTQSRVAKTLSSVYKTISGWGDYLSGKPPSTYVNPQWGKENIRTLQDIKGVQPRSQSVGMR